AGPIKRDLDIPAPIVVKKEVLPYRLFNGPDWASKIAIKPSLLPETNTHFDVASQGEEQSFKKRSLASRIITDNDVEALYPLDSEVVEAPKVLNVEGADHLEAGRLVRVVRSATHTSPPVKAIVGTGSRICRSRS